MKQYVVQCPGCCGEFFTTNGRFTDDKPANGSMFDAVQPIIDAGWLTFPLYDSTMYLDISCPSCGTYLVDSLGYIIRKREIGEIDAVSDSEHLNRMMDEAMAEYEVELPFVDMSAINDFADATPISETHAWPEEDVKASGKVLCPVCGELYALKGLHVHIKAKHPDYEG